IPGGAQIQSVSGNTITLTTGAVAGNATGDLLQILHAADQGSDWYSDIRAEAAGDVFSGPLLPDFDFEAGQGCHDTFISKFVGVSARVANAANDETGNGRHWDHIHTFNGNYPDVGG